MSAGSNRYYYVRNAQNDITGLIDASGTLVAEYKYDAWGNPISTTGTLAGTIGKRNPFRYRGYYWDEETGMYYLESRYYDPEIRQFISNDSLHFYDRENSYDFDLSFAVGKAKYSMHIAGIHFLMILVTNL